MHSESTIPMKNLMLQGYWSIGEAAERLKFLTGEFNLLLSADPKPAGVEIDLAAVDNMDACGCQLLAVFLENLRRRYQLDVATCGIPPEIAGQIQLLGYSDAIAASKAPRKETE
jgi:anti-anti-sigma regulatory factor